MIKNLKEQHQYFLKKMIIAWIAFTVIFLSLVIMYQWNYEHKQKTDQYELNVDNLNGKLDQLLDNMRQAVSTLPDYLSKKEPCAKMRPAMQSIVFNNFFMAGIVISDKNNTTICTTLADNASVPLFLGQTLTLFGPFKPHDDSRDFFLLREKSGDYYIGVYFTKALIDTLLRTNQGNFDFVGLYDSNQNKIVLDTGGTFDNKTLLSQHNEDEITIAISGNKAQSMIRVSDLENIYLLTSVASLQVNTNLFVNLLLLLAPLLILLWLLYQYSCKVVNKRFSLIYALNNALKEKEFLPYYQGVFDESKQCFSGAEVLIRWKTAAGEMIMPDFFIDEVEKSDLIVPITLQLIENAFEDCKSLFQQNADFHLAFNLSPEHFRDNTFFEKFYDLCSQYQVQPSQLMLELTERELFDKSESAVIETMQELRRKGFALVLDDFGTGQANINYLHHFPFNYLKIDKMFVNTIGTGAVTEALNLSIINMAHSLNMQIIAEGVETKEQLEYLSSKNVIFIQGWYYTKALPFAEFVKLIT